MVKYWVVGVSLFFVGAACSGGGEETDDGASPQQAAAYCQAIVDREKRCGNPPSEDFCDSYAQCIESVFRASTMSELTHCMENLACEQDDDSCLAPVSEANGSGVFSAYKTACEARLSACESEFTSERFFCFEGELGAATDAAIRENQSCLNRDCNDIRGCMDAVSVRNHCKG